MKISKFNLFSVAVFLFLQLFALNPVLAVEYDISGYLSIYGGKVLSGDKGTYISDPSIPGVKKYECPCFVADWYGSGVYEDDGVDFAPDSRAGIRIKTTFTQEVSFTLQTGANGGDDSIRLDWAYVRYQLKENMSVDIGRKGLPLYYFSDFLNVGYAYPWVRVPGDVYGWAIQNYNGIAFNWGKDLGDGTLDLSLWYGDEKDTDVPQYEEIYWGVPAKVEWKKMRGIAIEYNYDWLTLRAVGMRNLDNEYLDYGSAGGVWHYADNLRQDFYGLAFIADNGLWQFISEYNEYKVPAGDFKSESYVVSLGYRIKDFTPSISHSRYTDIDPSLGDTTSDETEFSNTAITLRWDFKKDLALKAQYDNFKDNSEWQFMGDSELFTVGVDYVF